MAAGKRADYVMVAEDDPQFMRFWNAYPKRVAKKDARRAWAQLEPSAADVDAMERAIAWQITQPSWTKDGGQFIPFPASWLRAERWQDERPVQVHKAVLSESVADPMRAWLEQKGMGAV
jgi:hypothetical protein